MNKIVIIVGIIILFAAGVICNNECYDTVEWTLTTECKIVGYGGKVISSTTDEISDSFDYEWFTWDESNINPMGIIPPSGPSQQSWYDEGNTLIHYRGFSTRSDVHDDVTYVNQYWEFTRVR